MRTLPRRKPFSASLLLQHLPKLPIFRRTDIPDLAGSWVIRDDLSALTRSAIDHDGAPAMRPRDPARPRARTSPLSRPSRPPTNIDAYLAALDAEQRDLLATLR